MPLDQKSISNAAGRDRLKDGARLVGQKVTEDTLKEHGKAVNKTKADDAVDNARRSLSYLRDELTKVRAAQRKVEGPEKWTYDDYIRNINAKIDKLNVAIKVDASTPFKKGDDVDSETTKSLVTSRGKKPSTSPAPDSKADAQEEVTAKEVRTRVHEGQWSTSDKIENGSTIKVKTSEGKTITVKIKGPVFSKADSDYKGYMVGHEESKFEKGKFRATVRGGSDDHIIYLSQKSFDTKDQAHREAEQWARRNYPRGYSDSDYKTKPEGKIRVCKTDGEKLSYILHRADAMKVLASK